MRCMMVISAFFLLASSAYAERYEYRSDVNLAIPDYDSTGLSDTIFVPVNIEIEDINFYIGIGTEEHHGWAEQVWIDVYSPHGVAVRLNDWGGDRIYWYWFWYDTDRPVDGPGSLDDYIGSDAYGPWVMHAFDMFLDRQVNWYYWMIEIYGEPMTGLQEEDPTGIPGEYTLLGNFPNPFNSTTAIKFGLPEQAGVRIEIYDTLGRLVRGLLDEALPAGYHRVVWDGKNDEAKIAASGVYLVRMKAGDRVFDKRMVMLK